MKPLNNKWSWPNDNLFFVLCVNWIRVNYNWVPVSSELIVWLNCMGQYSLYFFILLFRECIKMSKLALGMNCISTWNANPKRSCCGSYHWLLLLLLSRLSCSLILYSRVDLLIISQKRNALKNRDYIRYLVMSINA